MKRILLFLMIIPSLYALAICPDCPQVNVAQKEDNIIKCRKKYIESEQIAFIDHKILVNIEDWTVETPAIFSDEGGYFIQQVKTNRERCGFLEWECLKCGYCNIAWERCCLVCDSDKYGHKCR